MRGRKKVKEKNRAGRRGWLIADSNRNYLGLYHGLEWVGAGPHRTPFSRLLSLDKLKKALLLQSRVTDAPGFRPCDMIS